jgi:hypothetical protein
MGLANRLTAGRRPAAAVDLAQELARSRRRACMDRMSVYEQGLASTGDGQRFVRAVSMSALAAVGRFVAGEGRHGA